MTEDEQLESIKKWWKKYGHLVGLLLSLVLLGIAGYRYLNWHHEKMQYQASDVYEHMMVALSDENTKSVKAYANQLINEYSRTVYADAAHLTLAKVYVEKEQLSQAKNELKRVIDTTSMAPLKQVAKIRIARLLAADKDYSQALNDISVIDDNAYLPVINELKGDIFSALGQYQKAITSYDLANKEIKTNGMSNLFLEMKTNELAMKIPSLGAVK